VGDIVSTKRHATAHPNMRTESHTLTDGSVVVESKNDVSQIIKANKFLQGEQSLHHESETFNHVASIDMLAAIQWCKQRGMTKDIWKEFMTDEKLITEFLNDPDNKVWRTRLGKI
jgi:hypothetical protein